MIDIEKLLREGKTVDEIGNLVTNELNAAKLKLKEEEKERKRAEERKRKAAEEEQLLKEAREAAVAAFKTYLTLILKEEIPEDTIRAAIVELEEGIKALKNIKISFNGKEFKDGILGFI